jgi:hypothetical protein
VAFASLTHILVSKRPLTTEGSAASVKMAHTGPRVALDWHWACTACTKRRHIMSSHAVETGWQRFLDRLKQLWGKLGQGGKFPAAAG